MFSSRIASRLLPILIVALLAAGCEPVGPRVIWIIGVDVTPTVAEAEFNKYPQIAAASVLSRVRARDRVFQVNVNSAPDQSVAYYEIGAGKIGADQKAKEIYQHLTEIKQERHRGVMTNLGGFLAYAKRIITDAQKERQSLLEQGRSAPPEFRYAVVLITDGWPDGPQSAADGGWPEGVPIWAFGVRGEKEAEFRKLCLERMGVPEKGLHITLFSNWESQVTFFGRDLGRLPDPARYDRIISNRKHDAVF